MNRTFSLWDAPPGRAIQRLIMRRGRLFAACTMHTTPGTRKGIGFLVRVFFFFIRLFSPHFALHLYCALKRVLSDTDAGYLDAGIGDGGARTRYSFKRRALVAFSQKQNARAEMNRDAACTSLLSTLLALGSRAPFSCVCIYIYTHIYIYIFTLQGGASI